jgi:geranylgeranyl pyrophosphate synthase
MLTARRIGSHLENLVTVIGLLFQIRDDYQNLHSAEYESQKGFCEDLDEGKFTFPLIHCFRTDPDNVIVREILQQRRDAGSLPREAKLLMRQEMEKTGSMEYTRTTMARLHAQIEDEVDWLEAAFDQKNWSLRFMLQKLKVE